MGTVWFAFPYVDAAFCEMREEVEEKTRRRGALRAE